MRTIIKDDQELKVKEFFMTKNMWEYYVLEEDYREEGLPEKIQTALVLGHEVEIGDVDMEEIKPYIITRTTNLNEVMPPVGWSWK